MTLKTSFFVVQAPGHYGDQTTVLSSHYTVRAAKKAAAPGLCVRVGYLRKGDVLRRHAEDIFPIMP